LQPIRTSAEITAHIKILPAQQPYLYQKLSRKVTQLRLLGMSYAQIAKSLNINRKTATKACEYQGRGKSLLWKDEFHQPNNHR
jgi:DNA-binding CsgD family transcriptional regulator